jgi:nicotinamide-nucleotide amidase
MIENLAQEIGDLLKSHKLTLGAAESATGGLISHLITYVPGSSEYFKGAIICYSNEIKINVIGVKEETIEKYGAVSAQVCVELTENARKVLDVDICITDTGIAGPTGASLGKPIGLFYLGISNKFETFNRKYLFKGDREKNKEEAAIAALTWLKEYLLSLDQKKTAAIEYKTKEIVTCFIESENMILLVRRSGRVGDYRGDWACISGYVEKKSTDEQAWIEIYEETGLGKKDLKLITTGQPLEVIDEKLKTKWIVHPYLFYTNRQEKIHLNAEHTESRWIDPEELDHYNTVPQLKEALRHVLNRKKIDA